MSWRRDSQFRTIRGHHRNLDDPTAENAADPVPERRYFRNEEDLVRRTSSTGNHTPRRYEQPVEADDAPPPSKRARRRPDRQKR
jgi:hypothetical protein